MSGSVRVLEILGFFSQALGMEAAEDDVSEGIGEEISSLGQV